MKAFQQGHLDSCCGVYSIINALHLASGGEFRAIPPRRLFKIAMLCADQIIALRKMITGGIDTNAYNRLIKAVLEEVNKRSRLKFSVERPFYRRHPDIGKLHAAMSEDAGPGSVAYIIGLDGFYEHWTVVQRVTPCLFKLMDSDGEENIAVKTCTTGRKPRGKRIHIINPNAVFRIRCE